MSLVLPSLWDHQLELEKATRDALLRHRSVVLCAMTGVGKTRLAKRILMQAASLPKAENRSGRVLFCVHRRGLVFNCAESFSQDPPASFGVIMSGIQGEWGQPIQVGSLDSLLSWFVDGEYRGDYTYDFICFDECHAHLPRFKTFLQAHNIARERLGLHEPWVMGLSATPCAKGLSDVFSEIVYGPSAEWLTANNFMKKYKYYRGSQGRVNLLRKSGDEFTEQSIAACMEGMSGQLVRDWLKYGKGRSTVGFFNRRSNAREAVDLLLAAGIKAMYLDGEVPDDQRKRMFDMLNSGEIDYIANVGIVERGTDIPRIGCVQLCTAIGSLARYIQIAGRGARPHPEVEDCVLIDHASNIKRHGFVTDKINWSLDWTTRPSKSHSVRPSIECPQCSAIYRGGRCKSCGYEPRPKELKAQGLLFDGTELVEIKPKDTGKKAKSPEDYLVSALYRAGRSGKTFASAVVMARQAAKKDGVEFRVPKRFTVAGKTYESIPYGDTGESSRKVRDTYPFTVGQYDQDANPYCVGLADQPAPQAELF